MNLEKDCGSDCCDGSCSSLDLVGVRTISHAEVERTLNKSLDSVFRDKYSIFMDNVKTKYPRAYKALRALNVPHKARDY